MNYIYFQAVTILATVATFASAYPGGHGILIGGGGGYGGYGKCTTWFTQKRSEN